MTTCVPALASKRQPIKAYSFARRLQNSPSLATRYLPRNPVHPNTVATWPLTALRPAGPYEMMGFRAGRTVRSASPRCSNTCLFQPAYWLIISVCTFSTRTAALESFRADVLYIVGVGKTFSPEPTTALVNRLRDPIKSKLSVDLSPD